MSDESEFLRLRSKTHQAVVRPSTTNKYVEFVKSTWAAEEDVSFYDEETGNWGFNLQNIDDQNLHWNSPSQIVFGRYSDEFYVTAHHLAAMYRWPGPFDDGPPWDFYLELKIEFFQYGQPNLPIFHKGIFLGRLGYRTERWNVRSHWQDPRLEENAYWDREWLFSWTQHIVRDKSKDGLEFPPVTIGTF